MKPTDMDRHTKKRYYQLLDGVRGTRSKGKKYAKSMANRIRRRNAKVQCHKALTNPKLDIYDPDRRVMDYDIKDYGGVYVPYGHQPSKPQDYVGYDLRLRYPDPTYQEIKRLPKWMRAKIFRNLEREKDTLSHYSRYNWHRKFKDMKLPIKLVNEWERGT